MSIWIQVVVREWLMLMETFNLEVELGRKVWVFGEEGPGERRFYILIGVENPKLDTPLTLQVYQTFATFLEVSV